MGIPFGAEKWMTLPSDLNMLTSSMAWMGWTFIFLRVVCSFLSSVPLLLCTFFTFLRGVPLPLCVACQYGFSELFLYAIFRACIVRWRAREEAVVEAYPVHIVSTSIPYCCRSIEPLAFRALLLRDTYQCAPTAASSPTFHDPYIQHQRQLQLILHHTAIHGKLSIPTHMTAVVVAACSYNFEERYWGFERRLKEVSNAAS